MKKILSMKRVVAFICVLALTVPVLLCGCNNSNNSSSTSNNATSSVASSEATESKSVSENVKSTMEEVNAAVDKYISLVKDLEIKSDSDLPEEAKTAFNDYQSLLTKVEELKDGDLSATDLQYILEISAKIVEKLDQTKQQQQSQ